VTIGGQDEQEIELPLGGAQRGEEAVAQEAVGTKAKPSGPMRRTRADGSAHA